jgi:hypothetical protein
MNWLHKNISSHNIIFAPSDGALISAALPHMIGFHHSRLDEEQAFSEGPNVHRQQIEYQHPEYQSATNRTQVRFHRTYDYYSLGLVLLEIGFWTPLENLLQGKETFSPSQVREYLLRKCSRLDEWMGVSYSNAVAACLRGDFGDGYTQVLFESTVVKPLGYCFA